MKQIILLIILSLSFQITFAQKEEWTKHFEKTKEATTMDDDFYATGDSTKIPAIFAKYDEALELIKQVEAKSSEYKDAIVYRRAWINMQIAFLYQKIKNNNLQQKYINKAFEYWPEFNSISQPAAGKFIKFDESNPLDLVYAKMIYLSAEANFKLGYYETGLKLKSKLNKIKTGVAPFNEWAASYDIARCHEKYYEDDFLYAYLGEENVTANDVFESWVMALELWPALKTEDKDRNKTPFNIIIDGIKSFTTDDNSLRLRAANALYAVEKYADADKWFNSYSQSTSAPLEVGWKYSEAAMKEPDKADARNAVTIIEKYSSGFSEYDWERLQKVYEFIGDYNKVQEIKNRIAEARRKAEEERRLQAQRDEEERKRRERAERKANARGNFSLAVATNPLMYIWADYPVSLDIRIGRVSNEFRVNIANTRPGKGDNYHFKQWNAEGITDDLRYHYSGYEFSYTLKILGSKGFSSTKSRRKQYVGGYVGFQPRYSMYDFNPEIINFTNSTSNLTETHTISASAQRYEFCLMGGFLGDNLGGFFHVDYYFGVGIGYRNLDITSSSDPNFNTGNYTFDGTTDQRYEPKRWDKLYVPVRLGLRFGINLL
ncbi:MAG: hypothetical protein POELPBGB_02205 [Bacteroidia bacterium]|nr:hypothetical protein [Bacteroidia bacterium]